MNIKSVFNIVYLHLISINCAMFGHKWKYNFKSLPNKCICSTCKLKLKLDIKHMEWETVDKFEGDDRTDDELCDQWVN